MVFESVSSIMNYSERSSYIARVLPVCSGEVEQTWLLSSAIRYASLFDRDNSAVLIQFVATTMPSVNRL